MPLDPAAKAMMDQMKAAGMPEIDSLPPAQLREVTSQMFRATGGTPEPVDHVEDRKIPGPAGEIPVRIYKPAGAGPHPILVFFHGGGFVIGDLDSHDAACRALTNQAGCVTVAIDYRLAPEHKFPAAVDDCYAAAKWVAEHARELGGDPARLAVGGDSAGGNLSAVVALLARDRGGPKVAFQLLVYPATDMACNTYSHKTFTDYFLTDRSIRYFLGHYLRGEGDRKDPTASPALASSHKNLPPALVITAEFDPLRDEGEAYGELLRKAGVPVTVTRYDGMIHGFLTMGQVLVQGREAISQAAGALRTALGK
jgi:acetyl esterase